MPSETVYYPSEFSYYKGVFHDHENAFRDSKQGDIGGLDGKVFRFIFDLKYKDAFSQFIEYDAKHCFHLTKKFSESYRLIKRLREVSETLFLVFEEREQSYIIELNKLAKKRDKLIKKHNEDGIMGIDIKFEELEKDINILRKVYERISELDAFIVEVNHLAISRY